MANESYGNVVRRYWYLSLIGLVIFGYLGYRYYQKQPVNYTGSLTFTVGNKSSDETASNSYGGYYNLTASSTLADTVSGWLMSPNLINSIYRDAGLGLPTDKISALSKTFKTVKSAPTSSVVVAYAGSSTGEQTNQLLLSTKTVISQQFNSLKTQGGLPDDLSLVISDPVVVSDEQDALLMTFIGALAGLLFGIAGAFILESMRKN